jgi:hypothetical protein
MVSKSGFNLPKIRKLTRIMVHPNFHTFYQYNHDFQPIPIGESKKFRKPKAQSKKPKAKLYFTLGLRISDFCIACSVQLEACSCILYSLVTGTL